MASSGRGEWRCTWRAWLSALVLAPAAAAAIAPAPPALEVLAPQLWLLPGRFEEGRQPDGNSVLLRGAEGWLLVDSGRHPGHGQRLLDAVAAGGAPLLALVNSHWHLDHVGNNPALRAAHPGLRVFASPAIDAALAGFLADYRRQLEALLADAGTAPAQQADWRAEIARIDAGAALRPDVPVTAPARLRLAGRSVQLGLETRAASGGDVWLFDEATRTLVAGDLVTLPVPFFDTACPRGWQQALARLEAVDFQRLVPGHGAVLDRAGFERYRRAFDRLLACAASPAGDADCASRWIGDLGPLLPASAQPRARGLLAYYLEHKLAQPGQTAAACAGG